jgi:RNA 3'-terminal phosphate cyclase
MRFKGTALLRSRVICSLLSGEAFTIRKIREEGLTDYELRYLELVT